MPTLVTPQNINLPTQVGNVDHVPFALHIVGLNAGFDKTRELSEHPRVTLLLNTYGGELPSVTTTPEGRANSSHGTAEQHSHMLNIEQWLQCSIPKSYF